MNTLNYRIKCRNHNSLFNRHISKLFKKSKNFLFELLDIINKNKIKVYTDHELKECYDNFMCSICLTNTLDTPNEYCNITKCQHVYHSDCIQSWYSDPWLCPICRKKISVTNMKTFKSQGNLHDDLEF